jgi:hypothetical protein
VFAILRKSKALPSAGKAEKASSLAESNSGTR